MTKSAPALGLTVATEADGLLALVAIVPGRAESDCRYSDLQGGFGAGGEGVWVELSQDAAGVGPIRRQLEPEGRRALCA